MKIGIIADDLTGANDTGVQFAKKGLKSSVLMKTKDSVSDDVDVLIIDTDSRSIDEELAYKRVEEAVDYLVEKNITLLYKKIDSTMRGNIGIELDAIYNKMKPEFMIIAPGFPETNRKIINGHLFVNEDLIHETNFAYDPKNPIKSSFVPELIKKSTNHLVGLITEVDLIKGLDHVLNKMNAFKKENIVYILFDTNSNNNLEMISTVFRKLNTSVVLVGSAGLADYLVEETSKKTTYKLPNTTNETVMLIIGSVNDITRKQLEEILKVPNTVGVKLNSEQIVKNETQFIDEINRVYSIIDKAIMEKKHIILYSSYNTESIANAVQYGKDSEYSNEKVSERISQTLGIVSRRVIEEYQLNRLFITGGDTAKKICDELGVLEFQLIGEVEKGVPYGLFVEENIIAITKAGGFGTENVMVESLKFLEGVDVTCAQ